MGDVLPDEGPHYTYRVEWSPDYQMYMGRCLEYPAYYEPAPTAREALANIEQTVKDLLAERVAGGDDLPAPLTDHLYNGRILLRTSRAMHAKLTVEAAEQRVSLNQWIVQKLADRPANLDW